MTLPDLTPQEHADLTECAFLLRDLWREEQLRRLNAALQPTVFCRVPGCRCQYPAAEVLCPECGHPQDGLVFVPRPERPAWRLAFLRREGLSEIVVRRAGRVQERRTFRLEREAAPQVHNVLLCGCAACVAARRGQA